MDFLLPLTTCLPKAPRWLRGCGNQTQASRPLSSGPSSHYKHWTRSQQAWTWMSASGRVHSRINTSPQGSCSRLHWNFLRPATPLDLPPINSCPVPRGYREEQCAGDHRRQLQDSRLRRVTTNRGPGSCNCVHHWDLLQDSLLL